MNRFSLGVGFFVTILFLLIVAAGWKIFSFSKANLDPEIQMGVLVVVAMATLMAVLFVLAAGFSSMNLTDPKQALGLPEGSIRAMIALSLIMVFIIFGIYLFRKVGGADTSFIGFFREVPKGLEIGGKPAIILSEKVSEGYNVYLLSPISDDARKMAQQLITVVGTLVVAVSSFYFGSSVSTSAAKKEQELIAAAKGAITAPKPEIKDINPKEGPKGRQLDLEIVGAGFGSPRAVRLVRGSEMMAGSEILSNNTKVHCKVMIDKDPGAKWDVIVENEDGNSAQLPGVFSIT
jgi:hypothetical protein